MVVVEVEVEVEVGRGAILVEDRNLDRTPFEFEVTNKFSIGRSFPSPPP
jgi:hypothetical protein